MKFYEFLCKFTCARRKNLKYSTFCARVLCIQFTFRSPSFSLFLSAIICANYLFCSQFRTKLNFCFQRGLRLNICVPSFFLCDSIFGWPWSNSIHHGSNHHQIHSCKRNMKCETFFPIYLQKVFRFIFIIIYDVVKWNENPFDLFMVCCLCLYCS